MKDCLLVGFNDANFGDFVSMLDGMGRHTGAYRDVNLAFADVGNGPRRCLELLNDMLEVAGMPPDSPYENCDFVWPVVLYLSSYLHRRGFTSDYVNLFHREKEKFREKLEHTEYRCIVITTTLYVSPHPIMEIVEFIRDLGVTTPIIIGGPYLLNQSEVLSRENLAPLLEYLGGDIYVFSSEGEATLAKIVDRLRHGQDVTGIPNTAVAGKDGISFELLETERNSLEEEPINYGLFGPEAIGEFVLTRTSKSCPFSCAFCGFPGRAGKYAYTDLSFVEQELNALRDLGSVTTITFIDDTFNVPKTRFKEILRLMIERDYRFNWHSFYRSDHGDDETIELMAKAGCEGVFLGVESGCDRMLALMNKTSRKKHYEQAIKQFKKMDITTYGSFIIGYPGEDQASVAETIDFIKTSGLDYFRAQLFYLDPATPVWRTRESAGIVGGGFEWKHPTMTSVEGCAIIERMFLEIRDPVWLPQHGFEDWSLYYLRRKGFSAEEVRLWVDGFDQLVRQKVRGNFRPEERTAIINMLKDIAVKARRRASLREGASGRMGSVSSDIQVGNLR
jgi:anaerobic magnesium-protoporphyrin IX monomethyl ester cyclase